MTKIESDAILVLLNVTMEPSNVKKKVREPLNVRKKTVTCDVGTTQYEDRIVKCEKKVSELPNIRKELSYMMLELHNMRIEPLSVRKK